jgi:hypothetical protein
MTELLAQVSAPHMCAGLVLVNARVTQAAPILSYMRGWTARRVKDYCDRKGWTIERVEAPRGYVLDRERVETIRAVEADLLRSEGIDPRWPGFDEETPE